MARKKMLIIPFYVNHRGCPERCVFCNQDNISGQRGGLPSEDQIKSEIESYLESWQGEGRREVAFYGGTFTALPFHIQEAMLGAVKPYIDNGEINAVRLSTRPDAIDEGVLDLLKKYSVEIIELGVQSMDNEVLHLSGRGHTSKDTEKAAKFINDHGFILGCQLMPGLPGDSYEKSMNSVKSVIALDAKVVRIYPALVIKGTELENMFYQGTYKPLNLVEALHLCADMVEMFREKKVHVIRVGLQAEESLGESVISGPYHPAFGEMVESSIFISKARRFLSDKKDLAQDVAFHISPYDESAFRGYRNTNIKGLNRDFPQLNFNLVKDDSLPKGSLVIH